MDAVAPEERERQRTESLLEAQNRVLELIAAGVPLREVLTALALLIEEQSGGESVVSIFLVSPDSKRLLVGAAPAFPTRLTMRCTASRSVRD